MSLYDDYLNEIKDRKAHGLHPKPIDGADLLTEIVAHMSDPDSPHRADCLDFFVFNVLPGTTSAAGLKAAVLKDVITGARAIDGISVESAFEQLSHMKGGPSVEVLLDLALGADAGIAQQAAAVLKTQVFLYEADTDRLEAAHKAGNGVATDILNSYAQAEFFTQLPPVDETVQVVTYVVSVGDVSTDLLSPGSDAHSRSDRELHGYAIQRAVLKQTDEHVRLWPAMLYRSLAKLEGAGLIEQVAPPEDQPEDERRQYYALTAPGRARLREEADLLARWAAAAR